MAGVAILGFGVVGSGVAEVIRQNGLQIDRKLHSNLELKYILARREYPSSPFAPLVIHDFSVIENDPTVDIVVEAIGGVGAAKEYTLRALKAGKSVVTSNKELVATCGYELMTLAQEHGVSYLYEASVGGGIPIIRPLKQCLAANKITEIQGILNGTTNYILTCMLREGSTFQEALSAAQAKGYAESDPTADVEGHDACRKICILASLAFGKQIDPSWVPTEGISRVTLSDARCAQRVGYQIKLLGRAFLEKSGQLRIYVAPHLIPNSNPLSGIEGVFNGITVRGNAIGDVMFYGQGAGKLPTASAVVADVMEAVARKNDPHKYPDWAAGDRNLLATTEERTCRWYVRVGGAAERLKDAVKDTELISDDSLQQGECAALLPMMRLDELRTRLADLELRTALRVLEN